VFFFLPLAAALLLHGWHTAALPWPDDWIETAGPPPGLVGAFSTSLLLLGARPAVAVCLATAALVTAGFVFNEVFFYWFPNFGFAALLLVALLILNLAGRWIAAAAQILFTFTALFGLAGLALIGLSNGEPGQLALPFEAGHHGLQACGLAAIAFVGYDLLQYTTDGLARPRARTAVYTGLGIGGLVLCVYNTAALIHVEASRLAGTSMPYILTARSILGQTGRIVMGIVVIAGACAAVNLLFQAVARMMAAMAEQGLMPVWVGKTPSRPWLPLTVMAGMSGGLMALGFAGTDLLDLSLRAGLILWLISMGAPPPGTAGAEKRL
jgi:amino acid transporter